MAVRSVGMVDPAQYMNGTLDFSQKTRRPRPYLHIFSFDESLAMCVEKHDVYGPTPHTAETSPHGNSGLRRGYPNPPHAGEAQWNPNCSVEAKKSIK